MIPGLCHRSRYQIPSKQKLPRFELKKNTGARRLVEVQEVIEKRQYHRSSNVDMRT